MTNVTANDSSLFYARLPVYNDGLDLLLGDTGLFKRVPEDWHIILTDIKRSTDAIKNGAHEDINLIATGCIIATLNLARKKNLVIPFFFGGDGATLLVPPVLLGNTLEALAEHRANAMKIFNLDLRLGAVPVQEVYRHGRTLDIAKVKISEKLTTPIILGEGLGYAEGIIKAEEFTSYDWSGKTSMLDLNGMECRWDKLKPPNNSNEIVSLLVETIKKEEQATVFKEVIEAIDRIYGSPQKRKPFSINNLQLEVTMDKIYREMIVRIRKFNLLYLLGNLLITFVGKVYLKFSKTGRAYLRELIELTDTLIMDGRVNTVISGTVEQREALEKQLLHMESEGKILYGIYLSNESIMSCYVQRRDNEHIHFVDGGEGGYTQAARMLKRKRSEFRK